MWWTLPAPWAPCARAGSSPQRKRRAPPSRTYSPSPRVREAEDVGVERLLDRREGDVGARALDPGDGVLGRDRRGARRAAAGCPATRRRARARARRGRRSAACARRVARSHGRAHARRSAQKSSAGGRGDRELEGVDVAEAGAAAGGAGELEPREDRAGRAGLVAEVEVVGVGGVEVDRLLDQAEAEHVAVERDVGLGVGRDHRDVVQAVEVHADSVARSSCLCNYFCPPFVTRVEREGRGRAAGAGLAFRTCPPTSPHHPTRPLRRRRASARSWSASCTTSSPTS